jgi:peptidoglycan hydrolase CwlO-like protein
MKFDLTKILLLILVISVIVLGYGIFKTDKYDDSPNAIINKIALEQLMNDKIELKKQVDKLSEQQNHYYQMLKYKDQQITKKEQEIKTLQNKLYEKIKYANSLSDSSSFVLFSNWLTN